MNYQFLPGSRVVKKILLLISFILLTFWGGNASVAGAQSEFGVWETPWNISVSGTATEPFVVQSAAGNFYIFWQDRLSGYTLMIQEGSGWGEPRKINVPFTDPPFSEVGDAVDFGGFFEPLLRVDGNNVLHAMWLDDEETLNYSYAPLGQLDVQESWSPILAVTTAVRGFDLWVGRDGRLHVAYVQVAGSAQLTPGVYYRQSEDEGLSWSEPRLIYESNYLRSLEIDAANIHLAQTSAGVFFVVWDNPLLESVYLSRSMNAGDSWEPPRVIDQRLETDALESPGALNISVLADGTKVHLVWYAGHKPRTCTIYHQVSDDNGENWLDYRAVIDLGLECPESDQLFLDENNVLFMLVKRTLRATERTEIFLQAWDGEQWSRPELQETLTDYRESETFRKVTFDCLQGGVGAGNSLLLVACGSTRTLDDVWVLQRPLGELANWSERFAPPSTWQGPTLVATSMTAVNTPTLLIDDQENRHLFWVDDNRDDLGSALYYSVWNQREWSRPLPVLVLSEAITPNYVVALDPVQNRFLVVWHDPLTQELLTSQVEVEAASVATDWSAPQVLIRGSVAGISILLDGRGVVHLVYAIPINENRGVYAMESADGGTNWSVPESLFDAETADWYTVGSPILYVDKNQRSHLLLTHHFSSGRIGLYYSYLQGQGWSAPEERFVGNVVWAELTVDPTGVVHLLWTVEENGRTITWHSLSKDNGQIWEPPISITDLFGTQHAISLAQDTVGNLNFLQIQDTTILNREWDGIRWLTRESFILNNEENSMLAQIYALFHGRTLNVIYVERVQNPITAESGLANIVPGSVDNLSVGSIQDSIFLIEKPLDLPDNLQTPSPSQANPLPTPPPTATPARAETVLPTPTPLALLNELGSSNSTLLTTNNPLLQILIPTMPALFIVMLILGFNFFRKRKEA